jgi:hypothetical protein
MTSLSFTPLTSRIRQRLPGARPLHERACESVLVCEADEQPMRQAVFPPGEIERITGVHEFSAGLEDEIRLTVSDRVHHTATWAWRLRDVCVAPGVLCDHHSYRRLTFGAVPARPCIVDEVTETVAFCSTDAGNDYFAHALLDDATTALLGATYGAVLFGGGRMPPTPQVRDYLAWFNVDHRYTRPAHLHDAWIFTDHAQNNGRRKRLAALRRRLTESFGIPSAVAPAYIRRGRSGAPRTLANEAEIEAALDRRGFRIVDPEHESTESICRKLQGAPLIVGVEGSQLAHGVLNLAAGGGLLCIQPAARFNAVYRSFTNSVDLHWGFVVAEGTADRFELNLERLIAVIERMLGQIEKSC